jgi:magnesium transporter
VQSSSDQSSTLDPPALPTFREFEFAIHPILIGGYGARERANGAMLVMTDTDACMIKLGRLDANDPASLSVAGEAIRACLQERGSAAIKNLFDEHEPADIASLLDRLPAADALAIMRVAEVRDQALIFGYLAPGSQISIARLMNRRDLAAMMSAMSHDERADLFNRLDPDARDAILPGLAHAEREDLRKLSAYAEGTVGSVMTSDYATLSSAARIGEAMDALRQQAPDSETIYQSFIIDDDRKLVGSISLRELLLARPSKCVADIMDAEPIHIRAEAPREEASKLIARYDLIALPVVDRAGKLVGIITHDDAMDVQSEEATTDFFKAGGIAQPLSAKVRDASIFKLYRARIVWLVLLVFGNIFSGMGIALYEDTIAAYVALVFFLPLLIGSGGNAGSQASTLMVRALATGDVRTSDWTLLLGREVLIAALLGGTMAVAVSGIGFLRGGPEVALVVALSMIVIVLVGSLIGMSLPFILDRFKLDPATASAPLVTSIADATGVLIYFGIATRILTMPAV